jgi:hypothetical protein
MIQDSTNRYESAFSALRRLKEPRAVEEHCDFCNLVIPPQHRHLLETANRQIICSCDACAMRFMGVTGGRFKLIPRDNISLPGFRITDSQWDNLALPINLTFLYRDTATGKVIAMYPSPAGATESLLPTQNWEALEAANPALTEMEPDVEALLVNRIGAAREYFIAPMDVCYELVGLIRMHWRGLSGGEKVWQEIEAFFAKLRENAEPAKSMEAAHA